MTADASPTGPVTAAEVKAERDPIRKAIKAAIMRMLDGHPLHVKPGCLTIKDLAIEYGIELQGAEACDGRLRYHLYEDHIDLKNRFAALVKGLEGVATPREEKLMRENEKLTKQLAAARTELAAARQWKEVAIGAIAVIDSSIDTEADQALAAKRHTKQDGKPRLTSV